MRESANTVAHWTCGEGAGTTVQDSSGNSRTGTLEASATWATTGRLRQALSMPGGVNDLVRVTHAASLSPTNITVAVWAYVTANTSYPMFVSKYSASAEYELRLNSTTLRLDFLCVDGTNFVQAIDPDAISLNTWYFLVGTYDGANVRAYRDGVLKATAAMPLAMAHNTTDVCLGNRPGGGQPLTGLMDDILVENVAWSAAKVLEEFELLPSVTCYA